MKTIHFTLAAMIIASLATTSNLFAQIAVATDATCTEVTDNNCPDISGLGCGDAVEFTVPTTRNDYDLIAEIGPCNITTCYSCLAEAYIYNKDTGALVVCIHSVCGTTCASGSTQIELTAGTNYKLVACKVGCEEGAGSCTNCGTTCTAKASVTN